MATLIEAVSAYRPRIVSSKTIGMEVLARRLARGSLFSDSIALMVLSDLRVEVRNALTEGNSVLLPGLGRFSVHMKLDGTLRPAMSVDRGLRIAMRNLETFEGEVLRPENIGKSTAEIVALWNEEHPDNPVQLAPGTELAA